MPCPKVSDLSVEITAGCMPWGNNGYLDVGVILTAGVNDVIYFIAGISRDFTTRAAHKNA